MRLILMVLAAVMSAGLLRAEIALGSHKMMQTRFGLLQVQGDLGAMQLYRDGQPVPGLRDWSVDIDGAWGRPDEPFDWVLVTPHTGGNACEPPKVVLQVGDGWLRMSEPIGGCVYGVLDVRVGQGEIEVDLPHRDVDVSHQTIRFDGADLETMLHREVYASAVPAGAGPAVTRWAGQHPSAPFSDPAERARFLAIMSRAEIETLLQRLGPAQMAERRGDWVVGRGCMAHNCRDARGGWTMRVSDGAVGAFTLDRGVLQYWGADSAALRALIDEARQ